MSRLESVRKITGRWRHVLKDHRADYEDSMITAGVDLMDAVEAVLKLCDDTEVDARHLGRPNHLKPDTIRSAIKKVLEET